MEKINKYAQRFREVREELGVTQQDLADRLLLSRNFIAKIESGASEPSARTLSALESLLTESHRQKDRVSYTLHEDQAPYGTSPPEPREADVVALFQSSLGAAREVPGEMGYMAMILKMHLNPEQLRKLKD